MKIKNGFVKIVVFLDFAFYLLLLFFIMTFRAIVNLSQIDIANKNVTSIQF